ncbi:hypothetical protein [Halobacteriovorax sp. JY17]|uniref:hypothetical protein n=1 Tax=Halobacteriovorax sp. JY17 TaxID=2014617 RepID=UPI000C469B7F|nr:hypothetical protein [Halobacteriovorax sp. JY17]PIK15701.1 MAG: hypothetical protein CES88_02945 [Halobacteriovorax sp. JY17]
MIYFKRSTIFTFLLLLLTASCGQNHSGKSRSLASIGEEFSSDIKSLDINSQAIALRICNALRSKRSYWHTAPVIGRKATFQVNNLGCNGDSMDLDIETKISSTLMSNPIVFDSLETAFYFKDVITEAHGPLSSVCPSIFTGDTPLEFYSKGSDRIYTHFSKVDTNVDRLTLKFAEINSNDQQQVSGYKVYRAVSYDIVTSTKDSTLLGTAKEINQKEGCENKSEYIFTQKLISIL